MRKSPPGPGAEKRADAVDPLPGATGTPLPRVGRPGVDARSLDIWCEFLGRLATDADAAQAAAMAYQELDPDARDVWIAALEQDMHRVSAPRIAVYAPLLAVETDPKRRARVLAAIGPVQAEATPRSPAYALASRAGKPTRVAIIVAPLYLDFVQVVACAYRPAEGFDWVKHDPIVLRASAPRVGEVLGGEALEATPLSAVVDDLAITVVAHTRSGRALPEALTLFADLFGPGGGEIGSGVAS